MKRQVIDSIELNGALQVQEETGQRLGEIFVRHFGIPEERITEALAAQWSLPLLRNPEKIDLLPSPAPAQIFTNSGCLPVQWVERELLLACAEGPEPALALALERMLGVPIHFGVVSSTAMRRLRAAESAPAPSAQYMQCADRHSMVEEVTNLLQRMQPIESQVVRVGSLWWLRVWLEAAAREQEGSEDMLDFLYALPGPVALPADQEGLA